MQVASESACRSASLIAAQPQHQPAYRIRRIAAVLEQLLEIAIARDGLILLEGGDQIVEGLDGQSVSARRLPASATNTGCEARPAYIACSSLAPPGEQAQAFRGVADLVAQIVGPAAERIDVVEILMQALGQQKTDDVEIFVMMRRQPARVGERFLRRPGALHRFRRRQEMQWDREIRTGPPLRNDGGLQVAVVAHQVLHHFEQIGERLDAIHQILGGDVAAADNFEGLADQRGRVMEAGFERELGVVQQIACRAGLRCRSGSRRRNSPRRRGAAA